MKNLKRGDKILRINYDYRQIKSGKIYTFNAYINNVTIRIFEDDKCTYDPLNFKKVDLDIFNELGD